MKMLVAACILLLSLIARGDDLKSFSVKWLERGCISLMVLERDPENWTKEQEEVGMAVMYWLNGFLVGVNSMCLIAPDGEKPSPLTYPPEEWLKSPVLEQKILNFLQAHPEIRPDCKAREMMTAFYLANHPASGQKEKRLAKILIKRLAGEHEVAPDKRIEEAKSTPGE